MKADNLVLDKMSSWMSGWKFPSFALFVLLFYTILMSLSLLIPESDSVAGQFIKDFKVWCFGYDPATGKLQWIYVAMLLTNPFLLGFIIGAAWYPQLKAIIIDRPKALIPYGISSFLFTLGTGVVLTFISLQDASKIDLAFPGERIRTAVPIQDFELLNQDGKKIHLNDYKGKAMVITAFYSNCGQTCPTILNQLKRTLDTFNETDRAKMEVMAITLDPERDSNENLKKTAKDHGLIAPNYHFLNDQSKPESVQQTLDKLGFARSTDEKTKEINHANLFLLVDKNGLIAYRLTIGDTQTKWMQQALKSLVNEIK